MTIVYINSNKDSIIIKNVNRVTPLYNSITLCIDFNNYNEQITIDFKDLISIE